MTQFAATYTLVRNPPQHLVRLLSRTNPHKLSVFSVLPSIFLKTMYFTVDPRLQRVENRKLAPNTLGGVGRGGYLQGQSLDAKAEG